MHRMHETRKEEKMQENVYSKEELRKRKLEELNLVIDCEREVTWIGNEYGGFAVDCKALEKCEVNPVVFSFGVGEDISFDQKMIETYKAEVYAFDPTPKSISWVKNNVNNNRFHFYPYGISDKDGIEKFYLPQNPEYVSGSVAYRDELQKNAVDVQMKSMSTILKDMKISKIDILKMDIEGSEFKVIPDILKTDVRVDQICFELHKRFFNEEGNQMTKKIVAELRDRGYLLIFVSKYIEDLTFIHSRVLK